MSQLSVNFGELRSQLSVKKPVGQLKYSMTRFSGTKRYQEPVVGTSLAFILQSSFATATSTSTSSNLTASTNNTSSNLKFPA